MLSQQEELIQIASAFECACWDKGPQSLPAKCFYWKEYPAILLEGFLHGELNTPQKWCEWFQEEKLIKLKELQNPNYYTPLEQGEIIEPVIAIEKNSELYIWDGWHRVGSSFLTQRKTIPAIIGSLHKNIKLPD